MTTQLSFNFAPTATDKAATARNAGKDIAFAGSTKNGVVLTKQQIHDLPATHTFIDGCMVRKQTQPTISAVNWNELACEAALPLEPVADDEIFAVKR